MADDPINSRQIIKAASACVWRGSKVLIARRGKALGKGLWSLPGGKLESGESAQAAAMRELLEETGVISKLEHFVGDYEVDAGTARFIISCFAGHYQAGEAKAASDSDDVAWVEISALDRYRLAPNTRAAIEAALKLTSL